MPSALQSGSTTASQSSSHRVWGGGASRWCRACCTSGCCNLDPVRGGSLIPDYGSLGLRHADAQVCTHLQSPNLSIWLSAPNLKPRQRSLLTSKLWQQCRCLKWDVLLKLARWKERFKAHLLSGFDVWCIAWGALNCSHAEGSGLEEMKVCLCCCCLPELKWQGKQGGT